MMISKMATGSDMLNSKYIYHDAKVEHHDSMKLRDIRIKNLEDLIEEAGTARRLADLSETDPAYLSQIRTAVKIPSGKARGIGDKLAHKLEKAMGKPEGWMDQIHDGENLPLHPDSPFNNKPPQYNRLSNHAKEATDTVMAMSDDEIEEILPLLRRYKKTP